MARNNNTRMFLSVRKNMRMDEPCLSLTKILSLNKRGVYTHISILLDAESTPQFSILIDRLVLLQNVHA